MRGKIHNLRMQAAFGFALLSAAFVAFGIYASFRNHRPFVFRRVVYGPSAEARQGNLSLDVQASKEYAEQFIRG